MDSKKLAYLTAVTMGMMAQGLELPVMPRKNKPETKYDKKKCKSCKNFHKHDDHRSYCDRFTFRSPMDSACGDYQKRKKK